MNDRAPILRNLMKGIYDIQKLRIATGNRIVANFYIKLGKQPGDKLSELDDKDKKFLEMLLREYTLLATAITEKQSTIKKQLKSHTGIISDVAEFQLITSYVQLLTSEKTMEKVVESEVVSTGVWCNFLVDVKGVGPLMSGNLISELDPYEAQHASCFWKYCGYDVVLVERANGVIVGSGRGKKEDHLEMRSYTDKEGNIKQKKSITYNPDLKSKMYVLGTCLLRANDKYANIYRGYKFRLQETGKGSSDLHRHNMAIRYMNKMFLRDYWIAARTVEGLPVDEPYEVAVLGRKPHKMNVFS